MLNSDRNSAATRSEITLLGSRVTRGRLFCDRDPLGNEVSRGRTVDKKRHEIVSAIREKITVRVATVLCLVFDRFSRVVRVILANSRVVLSDLYAQSSATIREGLQNELTVAHRSVS